MTTNLVIRYANPDTTPSTYPSAGWIKADTIMQGDYWTLHGQDWALKMHVEQALADNNLNDYRLVRAAQ